MNSSAHGSKNNRETKELELHDVLRWKATSLLDLSKRLVLCVRGINERSVVIDELTMFKILYNESNPAAKKIRGILSTVYDPITTTELSLKVGQDKLDGVFEYIKATIDACTHYQDMDVLLDLAIACKILSENYNNNLTGRNLISFIAYEQLLRSTSCEAIGYWTAKLTERKKNKLNCQSRTTLSEANETAIGRILENHKIDNLGVFRADKPLRNKFMEECRKATMELDLEHRQPLSEDRIMRKAREIIKSRRLNAVKPAKTPERPSKRR